MGTVHQFPTPPNLVWERVKQVPTASIYFLIDVPTGESYAGRITWGMVTRCISDGTPVENPKEDEHGNWICMKERFVAGIHTTVKFALAEGNEGDEIYILGFWR